MDVKAPTEKRPFVSVDVAIVGAGPTGLMAAEVAAKTGRKVVVFDRMRQPARKFLLAGSDGLNLTFNEPLADFALRYDKHGPVSRILDQFPPNHLRAWADGLGAHTFVGTSNRVFPRAMKASPLLRAWLHRLDELGVEFKGQQELGGWDDDSLQFGGQTVQANSTVLAMGGASWPRIGTDGGWQSLFSDQHRSPLIPSNCTLPLAWSSHILPKYDGEVLKNIAVEIGAGWKPGDIRIVKQGLEGAPIYAAAKQWQAEGILHLDLLPHRSEAWLHKTWSQMPAKMSTSTKLKRLGLKAPALALVNEIKAKRDLRLPNNLKALPIRPDKPAQFDRAISTAGGIKWDYLTENLGYQARPNTYIGGEMVDWDAPTGGYLLQACFSMGFVIGTELAKKRD